VLLAGLAPGLAAAAKIDPEVEQALRSSDTVRVLVWIETPAAQEGSAAAKAAVAELLTAHPALEAKIRRRFETLPAFAAELTAEDVDSLRRSDGGMRNPSGHRA